MLRTHRAFAALATALPSAVLLAIAAWLVTFPKPAAAAGSGSLVITAGDPQSCLGCQVFEGTDQGPQAVQDQKTIQGFVQQLVGTAWSFKAMSSAPNGDSQGQVTVTKGGQPLFKQPAVYSGTRLAPAPALPPLFEQYEVFYSDKRAVLHATLSRNPPPSTKGTGTIFFTLIGDDGTPTSVWQYYSLTFSQ